MSEHQFICEVCNAFSYKGEFGYLKIKKSQQSFLGIPEDERHYFCNEHKAALLDRPEDERWDAFQFLKQEFLDYEECLLDPEDSFVGEVISPFR